MHSEHKEPLIRISKRQDMPFWQALGIRLIAVALALVVSAVVIYAIVHMNPLKVYSSMFSGNFGTKKRVWFMLRDTAVLACIAIGLAPAFKMRFWNIGAEGQMLIGGIGTAFFMIKMADKLPTPLLFVCMLLTAVALGALWGWIPGFFKAKLNANETLFTLMLNYIAICFTSYCVAKWENPYGSNTVGTINSQTKLGWIGNMFSKGYNGDFGWTILTVLATCIYITWKTG